MAELKDRYIRFDWAIKRLLRQNANFGVLEGFLTVFLNQPIKIVEILESEEGREAGLEEGRSEAHGNLLKTARKLKAMGLSVGDIAEAAGLSEKNVEKAYHDDLF